jgi:hypothetical protein
VGPGDGGAGHQREPGAIDFEPHSGDVFERRWRRSLRGDCSGLDAGIDKAFMTTVTIGGAMVDGETGGITGTKDKDYNVIWFTEACLSNVLRLETYIGDAEREGDDELADFFRRAQSESRKGAEQGKQLLKSRLRS